MIKSTRVYFFFHNFCSTMRVKFDNSLVYRHDGPFVIFLLSEVDRCQVVLLITQKPRHHLDIERKVVPINFVLFLKDVEPVDLQRFFM